MQASRNPDPLSNEPGAGFDCCFRIGKGFRASICGPTAT
jgi:hypothetical protein